MSILMVLTSHDRLGDTGKPTGLWLEEFATPYYIFRDEGVKCRATINVRKRIASFNDVPQPKSFASLGMFPGLS